MPESTLAHVGSGKVRELYALDDERLLLVASDRISTFDVVLPTEIPDKGCVLTGLSAFWFTRTRGICANHLLALRPDGRSTEGRRLEMLPIECVAVVTRELLVERWLRRSRPVPVRRPEARGVGRQHLVPEHEVAVVVESELELRVRDDDAPLAGVPGCEAVERE